MTDRIIFTALPDQPKISRVCADECRIRLCDLSTALLKTDQITTRSIHQIFHRNARREDQCISFDIFHHLMDDMYRSYTSGRGGGKSHQYRRILQKLFEAIDVESRGVLTPIQLTCGMSLLCRPEAGLHGVDVDSTTPIVEDSLRLLCPNGNVSYEKMYQYFTILFSVFISMAPELSKVSDGAKDLAKRFVSRVSTTMSRTWKDVTPDSVPLSHFIKWFREIPNPPLLESFESEKVKEGLEESVVQDTVMPKTIEGEYRYYAKGETEPFTGILFSEHPNGNTSSWQEYVNGIGQGK